MPARLNLRRDRRDFWGSLDGAVRRAADTTWLAGALLYFLGHAASCVTIRSDEIVLVWSGHSEHASEEVGLREKIPGILQIAGDRSRSGVVRRNDVLSH